METSLLEVFVTESWWCRAGITEAVFLNVRSSAVAVKVL
jgi:hypothetical protein